MTQEQTQGLSLPLVSVTQSPLQQTPAGDWFSTLIGLDRAGQVWTAIGFTINNSFMLTPWKQQQAPSFVPPIQQAPAPSAPSEDA
jgi:hypothetical protein